MILPRLLASFVSLGVPDQSAKRYFKIAQNNETMRTIGKFIFSNWVFVGCVANTRAYFMLKIQTLIDVRKITFKQN